MAYSKHKQVYTTVTELNSDLNATLRLVEQDTLEELLKQLYVIIDEEVYMKTNRWWNDIDAQWYKRTYDLFDIWEISKPYVKGGTVRGSIAPTNRSAFTHNSDEWQHSSQVRGFSSGLTTDDYVSIINDGLLSKHSAFGDMSPRPFWDMFLVWSKHNYNKIFARCAKSRGIPLNDGSLFDKAYKSNVGSFISK